MTNSVTLNGNTYNDGSTPPNNMASGGHRTYLLPMLSDAVVDFATKQAAALASQNAAAASAATAVNAPGTSATSTTSLSIALGAQSLTIQTGKQISVGMQVVIANTASPANWMAGTVTAYNSGTGALSVNITNILGSASAVTTWTISLSGAPAGTGVINELLGTSIASAATINLTTATGNLVHVTGTTGITAITIQTGAERTVICDGVFTITASAALLIPGVTAGNTYTSAVGDRLTIRGDTAGANITNIARASGMPMVALPFVVNGHAWGFTLSNDGTTPNTVIDCAAGYGADSTQAFMMNTGAITKSISSAWTAGSGNGGMGNGLTAAANTWYHYFTTYKAGVYDGYFDTSISNANLPAGLSGALVRYNGSFKTDASIHILPFYQTGQRVKYASQVQDLAAGTSSVAVAITITTPPGIVTHPTMCAFVQQTAISAGSVTTNGANVMPAFGGSAGAADLQLGCSVANTQVAENFTTTTNTSSQIYYVNGVTTTTLTLVTSGYINPHLAPNW